MALDIQVKIDVILHSTENEKKIFDSFLKNFELKQEDFVIQNLEGHFDNPITLVSIILKKKYAEFFIINLLKIMSKSDFNQIYENIDDNVYKSGLNIKISKQKMITGIIELEKHDAVKINISCPVYVKKNSKMIYQQLLNLRK